MNMYPGGKHVFVQYEYVPGRRLPKTCATGPGVRAAGCRVRGAYQHVPPPTEPLLQLVSGAFESRFFATVLGKHGHDWYLRWCKHGGTPQISGRSLVFESKYISARLRGSQAQQARGNEQFHPSRQLTGTCLQRREL